MYRLEPDGTVLLDSLEEAVIQPDALGAATPLATLEATAEQKEPR